MPKVQGHQLGGHCTALAPAAGGAAEELPRERRKIAPLENRDFFTTAAKS